MTERGQMWVNFLEACKPGTVVEAADTVVWQKAGQAWRRVGASSEYGSDSIASPVHVLLHGIS